MAPPPPQQQRHSPAVRMIAVVLLGLIVLVGLIVLITWLAVQPRKLRYSIEQGTISGYNLTHDRLNSNFHFVLRADNPNKHISLYYDRIDVTVLYEDQAVSVNNVHPFYQPRRNVTHLDMYLVAKDAALYGAVARDLKMEQGSGDVDLDVKIRAKIRLKVGVFKIHRTLKVLCEAVKVPFAAGKGFGRVYCDTDVD